MAVHRIKYWDIMSLVLLFNIGAFSLLTLSRQPLDTNAALLGGIITLIFLFQYMLFTIFFKRTDKLILVLISFLSSIGFIAIYILDTSLLVKQIEWYLIGFVISIAAIIFLKYALKYIYKFKYLYMAATIGLLLFTLIFGQEIGGARNWITIGGHSFQPSEFGKIMLIFALASLFSEGKDLKHIIIGGAFTGICLIFLVLQRDLGAAMLYFLIYVILMFISTSNLYMTLAALGAGGLGAFASYHLFGHVKVRILAWRNPWADITGGGYQIAQSLFAIAGGSWVGVGLRNGRPKDIPVPTSDFIFSVISEQFGLIIAVIIIIIFFIIILRGISIALRATEEFYSLVVIGTVSMIALQAFINIGGVTKFIPLTGITLPFISYGGSSMVVKFMMFGILQAIYMVNEKRDSELRQYRLEGR
ncbi:MAG: FtsW/RodA/SpoVE family cell cycle protein [Mahellales bacterium]